MRPDRLWLLLWSVPAVLFAGSIATAALLLLILITSVLAPTH